MRQGTWCEALETVDLICYSTASADFLVYVVRGNLAERPDGSSVWISETVRLCCIGGQHS